MEIVSTELAVPISFLQDRMMDSGFRRFAGKVVLSSARSVEPLLRFAVGVQLLLSKA